MFNMLYHNVSVGDEIPIRWRMTDAGVIDGKVKFMQIYGDKREMGNQDQITEVLRISMALHVFSELPDSLFHLGFALRTLDEELIKRDNIMLVDFDKESGVLTVAYSNEFRALISAQQKASVVSHNSDKRLAVSKRFVALVLVVLGAAGMGWWSWG